MKKILTVTGIVLASALIVILGLSLFVRSYFTGERLKAVIVPRLEKAIGKKAEVRDISISLFRGIIVKEATIYGEKGSPLAEIRELLIDYRLLPLIHKELIIKKISLLDTAIHIRRYQSGKYNFQGTGSAPGAKPEDKEKQGGLPVAIMTNRIEIRNLRVDFTDERNEIPPFSGAADATLRISLGRGAAAKAFYSGQIKLKELKTTLGKVPVSGSGNIKIDQERIDLVLNTGIGSDTVRTTGTITGFPASPVAKIDLFTKSLDLGNIAGVLSGKKQQGAKPAGKTGAGKKSAPIRLTAYGNIKADSLLYQSYTIRNFQAAYRYENKIMKMSPVSFNFSGGKDIIAQGEMRSGFSFPYDPAQARAAQAAMDGLTGQGTLRAEKISVKLSPVVQAIADFTGIVDLRNPVFSNSNLTFTVKDRKIFFKGSLVSDRFGIFPRGKAGFDKRLDVLADLKLSPEATKSLTTGGKALRYLLVDSQGAGILPLKITGTFSRPTVGISTAGIQKLLEQGLRTKLKEFLEKKSGEGTPGQQTPEDTLKEMLKKFTQP